MKFGINAPNHGILADPLLVSELAREAEEAGWEGFFVWDHLMREGERVGDTWLHLAAIASNTSRLRLGPMVTPLPRRKPWEVARQAVGLDHLSRGRLILGLGLGDDSLREFSAFGETPDVRTRAAMLEEGLQVIQGLWSGEPFDFAGQHFHVDHPRFLPRPVQSPRIPIWLAGTWPLRRPFQRAAAWDGVIPVKGGEPISPDEVAEIRKFIGSHRTTAAPFDLVVIHWPRNDRRDEQIRRAAEFADAGATWHLTSLPTGGGADALHSLIRQGPPVAGRA